MATFFIQPDSLTALRGSILFYPCAGGDWHEPLDAFKEHIDEYWFSDIAYQLSCMQPTLGNASDYRLIERKIIGEHITTMECRLDDYSGRNYRHLEPGSYCEVYERMDDSRCLTVIRGRGFGQYALRELPDKSVGVFIHRGDSIGEAGSNVCYLANRPRDHEPCSNLFDKLSQKLADTALIVSDGSNSRISRSVKKFHNKSFSGKAAFKQSQHKAFSKFGFDWKCVGYMGNRYGPTLVWEVTRNCNPWPADDNAGNS